MLYHINYIENTPTTFQRYGKYQQYPVPKFKYENSKNYSINTNFSLPIQNAALSKNLFLISAVFVSFHAHGYLNAHHSQDSTLNALCIFKAQDDAWEQQP